MNRRLLCFLLIALASIPAGAQKIVFMPQWIAQSQFAGFYMALEKGYYEAEGLDVTIKHMGINSTLSVPDQLYSGDANIITQQLAQSIIARSDGRKIINVMQITQRSGLCCVSHHKINEWTDLDGLKIGRWKVGFSEVCDILEFQHHMNINWVPCINGTNLFVYEAVDATLCYTYSELIELELATGEIPDDHIFYSYQMGYDYPEDCMVVTEDYYKNHKNEIDKFIRATKKGWDYAANNRDETIDVCMRICRANHVVTTRSLQRQMLEEYLSLMTNPVTGKRDYAKVPEKSYINLMNGLFETGHIIFKPKYTDLIK